MKKKLISLVAFGVLCGFCCSSHAMNVAIPENPTAMRSLLVGTFQDQVMEVANDRADEFWSDPVQGPVRAQAIDVQRAVAVISGCARFGWNNFWLDAPHAADRIGLGNAICDFLNSYQVVRGVIAPYVNVLFAPGFGVNPFTVAAAAGSLLAEYLNFAPVFDGYVVGLQNPEDAFTRAGIAAFVANNANWTVKVVEYLADTYVVETSEYGTVGGVAGVAAPGWDKQQRRLLAIAVGNQ